MDTGYVKIQQFHFIHKYAKKIKSKCIFVKGWHGGFHKTILFYFKECYTNIDFTNQNTTQLRIRLLLK